MKILLTFVCASIACVLVYGAPSIRDIHSECQADPATHLEDAVFKAIHDGESFDRVKVGAHMLCMTTKSGTQNQDGTINKSAVKEVLAVNISDETKLEEVTNKCAEEGPTPSETALKLSKCIAENSNRGRHGHGHHHGHRHGHHHEHH
nr:odorant binding protein 42 [Monochamus saltuarius]